MNKPKHSKASIFLLEIMLNVFFFTILVTICLQLFFKAHQLSDATTDLHHAVTTCNSIAEIYQSEANELEFLLNIYPDAVLLDDSILIYFDKNYVKCPKTAASYRAMLSLNTENPVHNAEILFSTIDGTEEIYTLQIASYHPHPISDFSGGEEP